jgi:16S rRNA (guanine966-N2)-methyltransferase
MRIIAGKHRGRRIELSKDAAGIRPTSEFAREAIFNILTHGKLGLNGHTFLDKDVLDIFCGTGAFGLEALSRGAKSVTFVDNSRDAIAIARHNITRMHEENAAHFIQADATKLTRAKHSFPLVFLDPPYFSKLLTPTLKSLQSGGWLTTDSVIVIEHDEKEVVDIPSGFTQIDMRRYGRAAIKILKLA